MAYCLIDGIVSAQHGEEVGIISSEDVYATALLSSSTEGSYSRFEVLPPPDGAVDYASPGSSGTISWSGQDFVTTTIRTRIDFLLAE
jgi:hypothetical protein